MVNISFWYCESSMSKWLLQNGNWHFFVSIVFNSIFLEQSNDVVGLGHVWKHKNVHTCIANWKLAMKVNKQHCLNFNVKLVKTFWSLVSLLMSCDKVKLFVILINIVFMTLRVWGMDQHCWLQYFQLPWHWQRFIEWLRKIHEVMTSIDNTLFPYLNTPQNTTHHAVNIFNTPFKFIFLFSFQLIESRTRVKTLFKSAQATITQEKKQKAKYVIRKWNCCHFHPISNLFKFE